MTTPTRDFRDDTPATFYADIAEGGDGATTTYLDHMGDFWHHGRPEHEAAGLSPEQVARKMAEEVVTALGVGAGDLVLDFGSGPGGSTLHMARTSGAHFVGVSNADALNRRARELAAEDGGSRASFLTIDSAAYRDFAFWPDGVLDGATFFESVCHLSDKDKFFQAVYRKLKPGAALVGVDWVQRPYGDLQTPEQIAEYIDPVCEHIRLAGLGTVDSYAEQMRDAGFTVTHAEDLFAGQQCWGSTPEADRENWLNHADTEYNLFALGKNALDNARGTGVFSVGYWIARKPA
ncbi:SAM-dependent methyltransferase [Actinocatenispora rupis]|uniref:Methyltransferase domain-containing protein n=1 Tax=Actinocatenispora rupis TaxID=519421 RepID=A0A8J3J6T6_9ACTN|nr:methyltransferase domain-containing protein [Actinocatenispora rupis]GID12676.1 hypothetical protein Aru02nite_35650 [Actinocatenispora rupis]